MKVKVLTVMITNVYCGIDCLPNFRTCVDFKKLVLNLVDCLSVVTCCCYHNSCVIVDTRQMDMTNGPAHW